MATYTESFLAADGSLATTDTDLTWTIVSGSTWQVVSNEASPGGAVNGDVAYARAEHDTASPDMYAQALATSLSASLDQFGPCVRYQSAADTSYMAMATGAATMTLRKTVNGTRTNLSSATGFTLALPQIVRTEISGSTLTGLVDGAQVVQVTDTSITAGTRGGMYSDEGGGTVSVDNFEFGDLSSGPITGAVNQTTETDTAQAASSSKTLGVNQATETDTAQTPTTSKTSTVSQVVETDTALPVTTTGEIIVPVGQATETSTVTSVGIVKLAVIGQASETNTALGLLGAAVVGYLIADDITGIARVDRVIDGPAGQRTAVGPALARTLSGPDMTTEDLDGPDSVNDPTPGDLALSRTVSGPALARTITGPEV